MAATIPLEAIFLLEDEGLTLQGRLSAAIVRAILVSRAKPGVRLPSSRQLAQALKISRMTVTLVYQELVSQGYLEALPRSGMAVASTVPNRRIDDHATVPNSVRANWDQWLSDRHVPQRVIRKPTAWRDYRYPFIYGQGDLRLFDLNAWRDCVRQAMGVRDFAGLAADQYGADDPVLLDYICSNTLPRRGINVSPDEVLVTMGAQNGLFLAVELLGRSDRLAVTEEPGYPDFAETLRRAHTPTAFLPVDRMGLDPDRLPEDTKLVIVTPSHHIPTGSTMPLARRQALLRKASEDDFLIIEDDYDFEMAYLAPCAPSLKSLDSEGRVIYLGSFSKSMFPGLRIGYMVGPAPFIAQARILRSIMLRHPPGHLQRITGYFLALGHYDAHIARLRETLGRRRAMMEDAIARTPLSIIGAAESGGSSMWMKGPDGCDSAELANRLRQASVLIEPGAVFYENPELPCPYFRLGFGTIDESDIPAGIELIAQHAMG